MYETTLFLHILGVLFMFTAVGITLTGMIGMLFSEDTKTLKVWSTLAVKMDGIIPFSVFLILIPGVYLVFTSWGWDIAWVNISLLGLVFMTLAGPIINLRRLKIIFQAVNAESGEKPSENVLSKVRDRVLWNSVSIMTMEVIAISYLMTIKPSLIESLVAIVIFFVLGFVFSKIALRIDTQKNNTAQIS